MTWWGQMLGCIEYGKAAILILVGGGWWLSQAGCLPCWRKRSGRIKRTCDWGDDAWRPRAWRSVWRDNRTVTCKGGVKIS